MAVITSANLANAIVKLVSCPSDWISNNSPGRV